MGQQQLLMIVLAIIIIAIAIAVSVVLFRSNAIEQKRDLLVNETTTLGTMALKYYKIPTEMGGGGRSFIGWQIPSQMTQSENGSFSIGSISADQVVIVGIGNEVVTGNDSIEVQTTVTDSTITTAIIH